MAFIQKTWKDRVAEFINRRTLTKEDGTTELVTVERSEGTISQEGDAFSAANMNNLEQRIADEFGELNSKINSIPDNNMFKIVSVNTGTASKGWNAKNLSVSAPGYIAIAIAGFTTNNTAMEIRGIRLTPALDGGTVYFQGDASAAGNYNATIHVLCVKSNFISP